ncbi:LuxR family transcriptional regulator [Nonomuraea rubra]|uniref:DNA-binding CsgD family transcriptional regulator n=2 Tax=Nonomuraea rubra TaxID=46180 RepID=A0A7X0U1N8_9ACTN|nr:LuxR family transcriptional regulator [Nonomuraea rubra]MBB6551788.1 DNA-binding CsgD family transcriptional regulator [Nonomuraea rubra]
MRLHGRKIECDRLDELVATVQTGRGSSSVLVVRGEAGIGKTALLEHARGSAAGCRVAQATGVESEMELAFSGLHQLCAPLLDRLHRLPQPRRQALEAAFGLRGGTPPDRFVFGLAVLGLLADVAEQEPLICLIDDAQRLDRVSAQTLAFVARRLRTERIGLVIAVREPALRAELAGLPELEVGPLSNGDARALLDSMTPGRLDGRVRDRIVAEAQGNPLALLELPRSLTPAELAAGYTLPHTLSAGQAERSFLRRVESLPAPTRQLLLIAAAEPVGDVTLLSRAARTLSIDESAAAPAESAGLITLGTRVRFVHPLLRSAAYQAATPENRQCVHRALAEVIDPLADPEHRAWHLANATAGPDETVAAELARSAERVRARSGVTAAAAFLERAAQLTPDPARRGGRALAAARAKGLAGGYDAALGLLDAAALSPLDEHERARACLLRGQITFASISAGAALPLLLEAARRSEALDPGLARESYRDALQALITSGGLPDGPHLADVARAILAAPPGPAPERDDLLLNGLAVIATEGYAAGAPMVLRGLTAFRTCEVGEEEGLGWLPLACRLAHNVWDFDSWSVLSARLVDLARETGALAVLPSALLLRVSNRALAGELADAATLLAEAQAIGKVTGSRFLARYTALVLEPLRGREAATRQAIEAVRRESALRGEGKVETATHWASAVLCNGLGRYEEAYAAAEGGCEHPQELGGPFIRSLAELVEAAVRSGRPVRAAQAAARLEELTGASGTDWALGTSACVRAQVSAEPAAEELYREAIERLGRTGVRLAHARALLLYGEWLRRQSRRTDAREQLGAAYELLGRMGAEAFAERARRELQATGDKVVRRSAGPAEASTTLTAQEAQIARLAGDGLTNLEIAAQLFISPHTVEWHLRKVFVKLGIVSRKQIRASLAGPWISGTLPAAMEAGD